MKEFYTDVARSRNDILLSGYDENGQKFNRKEPFEPSVFLKKSFQLKQSPWKALDGTPLEEKVFDNMSDANEFIRSCKDIANGTEIHGMTNWPFLFIANRYPGHISFNESLINILFYDIETRSDEGMPDVNRADKEVTLITMHFSNEKDTYYVLGCGNYKVSERTVLKDKNVVYVKCVDEKDLLMRFRDFVQVKSPDIITGWNIDFFDMPYLYNRIVNVLGEKFVNTLSPWNQIRSRKVRNIRGTEETVFDIIGIQQLDYIKIFKKFGVGLETPENYQLNTVAQLILGEEKIQYDEEYDSLDQLYLQNYQKFVDYGLYDTDLIVQLENALKFLSIAITIAYKTGANYSDALGTTAVWDSFIHRYLREKFVAIPPQNYNATATDFEGGYVKDPQKGIYDWILSFDFASLYPNLIVQFNMSPETIVEGEREFYKPKDFLENENLVNRKPQYAMAANGVYFRKDQQGVLPALIEEVYAERVTIKNKMIEKEKELEEIENELKRRGL